MNKKLCTLLLSALTVASASAAAPMEKARAGIVTPGKEKVSAPRKVRMQEPSDGTLSVDFSRRGVSDEETYWSEDFDDGLDGWTVEPTTNVTWLLKNASTPFSTIKEGDKQSLYTDTPYQTFKREKSWVTSPSFAVPANAMLRCWLYFSLNYKEYCALEILVSTDDFATSEKLYTSLDEEGEKPSQWRHIGVSLDKYAGKNVKIRFMYTYGTSDSFQTGGYMGDFYIDGIEVTAAKPSTRIEVTTGEKVEFIDLSAGNPVKWLWTMPGAVPATSTEQNPTVYYTRDGDYDVTLEITGADGKTASLTKTALVHVTGTEPVAHILPPATFRYATTRNHMVAPMARVTFADASEGFPTEWNWSLTGVSEDADAVTTASTESVDVNYWYQHQWTADLKVANQHGESTDHADLSVEYQGSVNNLLPTDNLTTFDLEGRGTFPGSNSMKITAYAEKFSAPSVPSIISGATVFFTKNTTVEVVDQIANVGVHLYTCENGKPGKKIDSSWWSVFELEVSQTPGQVAGTAFPFTSNPVVSDEFFIVIDGIPDTSYGADVAFAMADFRADNGTAWMLKDGEWVEVSSYFPAGKNHTSYAVYPYITHSVIAPLPMGSEAIVNAPAEGGTVDFDFFSIMGWKTATSDSDWCRVTNTPGEMTVDKLQIECDAKSDDIPERSALITVTDGVSEMKVTVTQSGLIPVQLTAPQISFSAPADSKQPVTVTITNPNIGTADIPGTIVYRIGTSEWFDATSHPVTFDLKTDGKYNIDAYVRHDTDPKLNSEITSAYYEVSGVDEIAGASDRVYVEGNRIIAPEDARIFTSTGLRVNGRNNLSPGIYIVRLAGGRTVKLIVG